MNSRAFGDNEMDRSSQVLVITTGEVTHSRLSSPPPRANCKAPHSATA